MEIFQGHQQTAKIEHGHLAIYLTVTLDQGVTACISQ